MKRYHRSAAAFALTLASLAARAEPPGGETQRRPPPEAFSACTGKSVGDKVSVTMGSHTMEASCEKFGEQLAARPTKMPGGTPPDPR
ncbi:hypothetical protein [Hydrocarboniphaga sp.]|uniref:hypothetical protein n=1 Tax=Hydrocarboniphaga sp. TaxID=2033016 RepID=UPI00262877DC|nr:hypothetical protein [Hydrocarboniphaga sp.]